MSFKKPNFFILGAPKCGTTSLAYWLSKHPNLYMSPVKEPFFFNKDHNHSPIGRKIESYEKLFSNVKRQHKAIGEASTKYLVSDVAVSNIIKYNPKSKFIVCLRNPVNMAYSFHQQALFSGTEEIEDFEKAWFLQGERKKGNKIPERCVDDIFLQYGEVCSLGSQCGKLMNIVPRNKIKFMVLDDLKNDPLHVYKEILKFLGLEYDGREDFSPRNSSKVVRSKTLQYIFNKLGDLKRKMGIYKSTGIYNLNSKKVKREPLSNELRFELEKYFEKEIKKLEEILNRDLAHWFKLLRRDIL